MMGVFESWYQIQGQRGMKWEHWALGAAIVSSFVCTLLLIVNIVHVYGDRASSSPPIASRRGTGSVGSSRFAEGLRLPARTPLRSTAECRRKWPELVQSDCEKVKRLQRKEEEAGTRMMCRGVHLRSLHHCYLSKSTFKYSGTLTPTKDHPAKLSPVRRCLGALRFHWPAAEALR